MKLDTSKLHLDILDKTRQDLLKKIMPVAKYFVLGGGTALSLQIAHRKSFDFDFFSEIEIAKDLKEYCKLDTYAMYQIWKHLYEMISDVK